MIVHLVESTLFAIAVWLVTLALRRNPARVRHALWMAASVKFLVPFSLLVALGSHSVSPDAARVPPPQMRFVMVDAATATPLSQLPVRRDWRSEALWLVWFCGCAGILIRAGVRWRAAAARLRHSTPWRSGLPVPVRTAPSLFEPGVFGLFRPVLVLPEGIEDQLSDAQLQAVLAHELCHARHRDNLAAALHMLVEALFWFHPLVWWVGARLMDERERACDEEVVALGRDRALYAESILRVCQFCIESQLPCVPGITGADLKRRIGEIMLPTVCRQLGPARKALLAAGAAAAVAVPLALGLTHPAPMRAQTAAPLRFDVASVKVSDQHFLVLFPQRSGVHIHWTTSLGEILDYAYRVEGWRVSGAVPGNDHIYAVDATTDANATDDQVRLMFQSLQIDRFHMAAHRETKDVDGFVLTVAKGGLKVPAAKEGEIPPLPAWFPEHDAAVVEGKVAASMPEAGVGAIVGRRVTMQQFSGALQRVLRLPVIDGTGAAGKYYFGLKFAQEDHPAEVDLPDLATAVQSLGLRLERHKGPVEMLVVDHIDKVPTEN